MAVRKFLTNFQPYKSGSLIEQGEALSWLAMYQNNDDREHYSKYGVKPEYIASRVLYAKGIAAEPFEGEVLYNLDRPGQPTVGKRGAQAQEKIQEIFNSFYKSEDTMIPDHINHVSCTHYESPSAAQKIVSNIEWPNKNTIVTHLYHMGCYAALPSIRVAGAYISDGSRMIDNIHTELCSFHLDRYNISAEQTIMNTLFADGAIKYSITNEEIFWEW